MPQQAGYFCPELDGHPLLNSFVIFGLRSSSSIATLFLLGGPSGHAWWTASVARGYHETTIASDPIGQINVWIIDQK